MKLLYTLLSLLFVVSLSSFTSEGKNRESQNLKRAKQTLDSLYQNYSVSNTYLLRENYPLDKSYTATYLASEPQGNTPNPYSYLWPYSGTFSAVNALFEATEDKKYKDLLDYILKENGYESALFITLLSCIKAEV